MRYSRFYFVFLIFVLGFSCEKPICQSPPPTLRFILMQANGTNLITATNAEKVSVSYTRNDQLARVNDLHWSTSPTYALESYEMNVMANQLADTTHFYVSVGSERVGPIQLKTYVDNSRCDGWTHVNELRFAGQLIPYDNMKPGYTLIR